MTTMQSEIRHLAIVSIGLIASCIGIVALAYRAPYAGLLIGGLFGVAIYVETMMIGSLALVLFDALKRRS